MPIDKPYVLGLDVGGTNSVVGVVDARGHVLGRTSIKTKDYPVFTNYVEALCAEIEKVVEPLGGMEKVRGLGGGVPNACYYTGMVDQAANLPWSHVPFAQAISDKLNIPVSITNDANAAAMGEMMYGVAKGMKNFITITLGTGVGSGIVIDGKVVYGHDGFAGELGHTTVVRGETGRLCGCGRKGCLEAYASATGVARTAKEILETTTKATILRDLKEGEITSKDVYDAAMQGDEVAKEIFNYTGTILGESFANFILFSAPEAIVIFGGLSKAGELLLDPIRKAMNANVMYFWKDKVKLLLSDLKEADAAILGASALAWEL